MSLVYARSNQWGPYSPNITTTYAAGSPDPGAVTIARTDPNTLTGNVASQNTGRTQMATQTFHAGTHVNK
jgi:hypothetical protein